MCAESQPRLEVLRTPFERFVALTTMAIRPRVLLIEDDQELGQQVKTYLERAGCDTEWWQEGRSITPDFARKLDLVVLDIMLPGRYGLDVLKELRRYSEVPVLVLSARGDTSDKVRALQLGADDYVTKPFWPEELLARVKARLRRPRIQETDSIEVGDLIIDRHERRAVLAGTVLDLTPSEFGILLALANRPGAAVSRRTLVEDVLDADRQGTERTLDVHVSRLRRKLGREGMIETVWGIGYRLRQAGEP